MKATTHRAPASGKKEAPAARLASAIASLPAEIDTADRLIDFREANTLLSSKCKTAHVVLGYAKRGQIRAVYLNERCVRFSLKSVLALVAGRVQPVAASARLSGCETTAVTRPGMEVRA